MTYAKLYYLSGYNCGVINVSAFSGYYPLFLIQGLQLYTTTQNNWFITKPWFYSA